MEIKKTALYEIHEELGADMVEFAGYLMPLSYESFKTETLATRNTAGLFDISHMGRVCVSGRDAKEFLQKICTNDITKLKSGRVLYTLLCNEKGGTTDDIIVYQGYHTKTYILVINASNFRKDLNWLQGNCSQMEVEISDFTAKQQMIALQGPNAARVIEKCGVKIKKLRYFHWKETEIKNGIWAVVSRTGYSGEDGFEIIVSKKDAVKLWRALSEIGKEFGLKPAGLGARDILRLEAGLPLYGHELSEEITPLEAGLERFVCFDKQDFIGREALLKQRNEGVKKKLIGFEVLSGRIAHQDYLIFKDGHEIGQVASGSPSWILGKSIGTGFVKTDYAIMGNAIEIDINNQKYKAKIIELPFYKKAR